MEVVQRSDAVTRIAEIVTHEGVEVIVVGLPTGLSGNEGESARLARELGAQLETSTGVRVDFVDERFTSKIAESALLESGMSRQDRKQNVDKVAAAVFLQDYLDHPPKGNHGN
jgi:putative Holliday junction resolvase